MTEQLGLTLIAASVGFVSAVLFCVGNVSNTPRKILTQATPFWDFSEPVARALAEQRAQYIVGAFLLLCSFVLQIAAVLASSNPVAWLPFALHKWPMVVLPTLSTVGCFAVALSRYIYVNSMSEVLMLAEEQMREDMAEEEKRKQSAN